MTGCGEEAVCLHSRGHELAVLILNHHKLLGAQERDESYLASSLHN